MATLNIPADALKGASRYITNIKAGDTVVMFTPQIITGYEAWKEVDGRNVPVRFPADKKPTAEMEATFVQPTFDGVKVVNFFLAGVVKDLSDNTIKIFSTTKKSVIESLAAINEDAGWNGLENATIKINKTGEKMLTEYKIVPSPRRAWTDAEKSEAESVDLSALFRGEDPFNATTKPQPTISEKDDVTFENF